MRKPLALIAPGAVVALGLFASTANAAPPVEHYHVSFTCISTSADPCPVDLPSDQCGIPGTTVDTQWGNVQIFADNTAKMEIKERYVFTSAVTGKSFESLSAEQLTENTVPIDNGDGTVSFFFTFKGLEQQLKLPNGSILARDAGPVTFTLTFDAATGDFISFTKSGENGPHPLIDGDLFCHVVVPALR